MLWTRCGRRRRRRKLTLLLGTMSILAPTRLALSIGARRSQPVSSLSRIGGFGRIHAHFMANQAQSKTYGANMDQQQLMDTDRLITVDENDILVPNVDLSKKAGHSFSVQNPRATLHRAFSFFLFDAQGRMLLTQRAASKITFPKVWTNTCCSHPLYGMQPDEVDITPDAYPSFAGIKHAAIRKTQHELGILPQYVPHEHIQFISRFHYWATDTITYGTTSPPWGEHEVDYILFLQHKDNVPVNANPDEVGDYKWVTLDDLQGMLRQPNLLWSPWFLGILERGGWDWWRDLPGSLAGKYTNTNITFFDPPAAYYADYNLAEHGRTTGVVSSETATSRQVSNA